MPRIPDTMQPDHPWYGTLCQRCGQQPARIDIKGRLAVCHACDAALRRESHGRTVRYSKRVIKRYGNGKRVEQKKLWSFE